MESSISMPSSCIIVSLANGIAMQSSLDSSVVGWSCAMDGRCMQLDHVVEGEKVKASARSKGIKQTVVYVGSSTMVSNPTYALELVQAKRSNSLHTLALFRYRVIRYLTFQSYLG